LPIWPLANLIDEVRTFIEPVLAALAGKSDKANHWIPKAG
jgi:hypothetical protein